MEQVGKLKKQEGESIYFIVEEFLLATQPLNETNADTDAVDEKNDDEEVYFMMTPPSNSEVLNVLKVLQTICLYHDVGKEMRKNVNSFEKPLPSVYNQEQKAKMHYGLF